MTATGGVGVRAPGAPVVAADQRRVALESRWSAAGLFAVLVVFGALIVAAGPFYPTFDEQKYLGIASNIWAGHGITTVFGTTFTAHAPLWTILLGAPRALFGGDNLAWGRFLDAVSGLVVVGAAGFLGWRVRPAAGAVAALAMVATLYLHDQSRTARLDVPAAALALVFVIVGLEAVRRASAAWAFATGVVFAIGFVVKEIDLPLAPAPFLAAALWGTPWRTVLRAAGWMTLAAAIGVGWWFVLFAQLEHEVYRLGTPAWTLLPLTAVVIAIVVIGIGAERLAAMPAVDRAAAAVISRLPDGLRRHGRPALVWVMALGWSGLLTFVFLRTGRLTGTGGLAPAQLALYARTWFGPLAVAIVGVLGLATVGVIAAVVDPGRVRRGPVLDLAIASLCGLPLVLLVVAVGEPPRNYLAQIAIVAALGGVGVVWLADRLLRLTRPSISIPIGAVIGGALAVVGRELLTLVLRGSTPPPVIPFLVAGAAIGAGIGWLPIAAARAPADRGTSIREGVAAAGFAAALLVSSGLLGVHALARRVDSTDPARAAAVETTTAWLRESIAPSETIAFGSFLGYDMALGVQNRNPTVQVRHRLSVVSAAAPEGVAYTGEAPASDWIAVDIAPRNANQLQAYRAAWLKRQLPASRVGIWVYTVGIDTAAPSILPALVSEHGFDLLKHWTFPVGGSSPPIETYVYRVNLDRLSFDTSRLYISPEALHRLTLAIAARPDVGRPAAAALVARVVVTPPAPAADADLTRLRQIAAG